MSASTTRGPSCSPSSAAMRTSRSDASSSLGSRSAAASAPPSASSSSSGGRDGELVVEAAHVALGVEELVQGLVDRFALATGMEVPTRHAGEQPLREALARARPQ